MDEKQAKIALVCIFKDDSEYNQIKRMLESFMPHVDGLVCVINGISGDCDKLVELIKKYKGVYEIADPTSNPELYSMKDGKLIFSNFAGARNLSFQLADKQEGYDWYTWADCDDILNSGEELRVVANKALGNCDTVFMTYWYSVLLDDDGRIKEVVIEHIRERLLRPKVFKWVSRLHEVALPIDDNYKPINMQYDLNLKEGRELVWIHLTDEPAMQSSLMRNIDILEIQANEENYTDPRTVFYLAKTLWDLGREEDYQRIDSLLDSYLKTSGWEEERSSAWEYKAKIACKQNNHRMAVAFYLNAIESFPSRHMPYLLLANEYAEIGQLDKSNYWTDQVLKMTPPSARTTIGNPAEIKLLVASLKYNQQMREGKYKDAKQWLEVRHSITQAENEMLKTLEEIDELNQAAIWVFNYAKWLKKQGHIVEIKQLLKALPLEIGRESFVYHIANDVNEPKVWENNEIAYFASFGGEHFEGWSPASLTRGIGGSETAVIRLAEEWVKNGYKVTVYGDPRDEAGEHNGVIYRPWYEMNWKDEFNILILWRSPHLLDRDIKANKLYMDLHDMVSQLDYTPERIAKLDKVFFKSEYHAAQIPQLPEEKKAIISNGI